MKSKNEILKLHKEMVQELRDLSESQSQKLFKEISKLNEEYQELINLNLSKEEFKRKVKILLKKIYKKIIDIIYNSLESSYSITVKYLKKMYGNRVSSKKIDLDDLTYQKDGLTLEERVNKHLEEWVEKLVNRYEEDNPIEPDIFKRCFFYQVFLILDTEIFTVNNNLSYQKMYEEEELVEVVSGGNGCGECEDIASEGIIPIEELNLPPYHPNCQCTVIYWGITDDKDDEEDLDIN